MTNAKTKRILIKAAMLLLVTCTLIGGILYQAPTTVSAAAAQGSNVFLDWREVITDPRAVTASEGTYYAPTAYVYFGEYYNSITQSYEPLLNRVLDADADNLGNAGAIFLTTQNIFTSMQFTTYSESITEWIDSENSYLASYYMVNYPREGYFEHKGGTEYYADEIDYIRAITKSDDAAAMDGLFGLAAADGGYTWDVVTNPILNEERVFMLSVEEVAKYIGTYSGASTLRAKHVVNGGYEGWWLRTAVDDFGTATADSTGNLVAYVTANGDVRYTGVHNTYAIRPAFNLETADIAFAVKVGENTYRLAMHEPTYKDTQTPFSAELVDVRDGVVTLKAWNYIGNGSHADDESEYISYIVFDESGNEKYYSTAEKIYLPTSRDEVVTDKSSFRFTLPDCYEQGDSIKVFWERKSSKTENHTGYVSNMVDLGCIHTPAEDTPAYCSGSAVCAVCGEAYGYNDANVHIHLSENYVIDTELNTHSLQCTDCGTLLQTKPCTFRGGTEPINCIDRCLTCGNVEDFPELHDYNENGVCTIEAGVSHYQLPVINKLGNWGVQIIVENEGQWNALAEYLNAGKYTFYDGEQIYVTIGADLDFTGMAFIPWGTETHSVENIDIDGKRHTVSGITFKDTARGGVGLLGVADDAQIEYLFMKNCTFEGASDVGVVIGRSKNLADGASYGLREVIVTDSKATAADGSEGGLIGACEGTNCITMCFLYNVKNSAGEHLDFSGDGGLTVDTVSEYGRGGSYRLAETGDGMSAMTAEEFASGIVAYRFGGYWRQLLDSDRYPVYAPDATDSVVYRVMTCDGSSVFYMNEDIGQLQHGSYTAYHGEVVWNDNGIYGIGATIEVTCGSCNDIITVACELEYIFYGNGTFIAKMDTTPYVTVNGEKTQVGDTVTQITTRIETLIGMTYIEKDYDGHGIYPEDMMDNHRLVTSPSAKKEFEVYFVNPETGERYQEILGYNGLSPIFTGAAVSDVGTYDLLVVGKSIFEGQEYLYKGALVIRKTTVTVAPQDVYKYYDGNGSFEAEYTVDNEHFANEHFDISLVAASSSAVGEYVLDVVADLNSHSHGDNITVVLARSTVNALILPNIYMEIGNKSYPTEFTYGDVIPTPEAAHFSLSAPATLTYEWFEAELDEWGEKVLVMKPLGGTPVNAGQYLLRVRAVSTDGSLVSATLDIPVKINQKMLTLELIAPEGAEIEDRYGTTYYVLDPGEVFTYKVHGFVNGETLESTGMRVSIYLSDENSGRNLSGDRYVFPYMANERNYQVSYTIELYDDYGRAFNYTREYGETVYVDIKASAYTYPVLTTWLADGSAKGANLLVAGPVTGLAPNGETFDYTLIVKDASGKEVGRHTAEGTDPSDIYGYFGEDGEFAAPGTYTVEVTVNGAGMNATYSFKFTVLYKNDSGAWVNSLVEMGRYQAYVYMGEVTAESVDADGILPTTEGVYVYVQREISMNLKPHDYNLTDGEITFDPTKLILQANGLFLLGHTLSEVDLELDPSYGTLYVKSIKVLDGDGNDVTYLYSVSHTYGNHTGDVNVVHVFDNPCDSTCNVYGCDTVRAAAHSGGTATCSSEAICDVCGTAYGGYVTDRHISTATRILPNVEDRDATHLVIYTCCGGVKEAVNHTPVTPATCIDRAVCTECGWIFGEVDPTNHASDARSYAANGTTDHIITYLCCGATAHESHTGGVATCNKLAACTLCGGEHGVLDPENHTAHSEFKPDAGNRERHNEIYPCCGHTVPYAHEGGHATCIHYAVCEICGGEYGQLAPANHATAGLRYELHADNPSLHNIYHSCCDVYIDKEHHTGGTASCISGAVCEHCESAYGEINIDVHATAACSYYRDPENAALHIKIAACCKQVLGTETHAYGEATCTHAARCACGAEQGELAAHVFDNDCDAVCNVCGEQARAEIFHTGEGGSPCEVCGEMIEKESISGSAVSGIITGSTVVVGTGGFSLFWFVIKKKSWAELLGLLIG